MTQRPTLSALGANAQVLLDTYDTGVLGGARWLQEALTGAGDKISPMGVESLPMGGRSLLTNGGFEINQGGIAAVTSPDAATWTRSVDGWNVANGTATVVGPLDGDGFRAIQLSSPNPGVQLRQKVFGIAEYRGKSLCVSARVGGGFVSAFIYDDGGGTGTSPWVDCTATKTVAIPYTVGPTATYLYCGFSLPLAGTVTVDKAMLTPTLGPVAYQPEQPALAWRKVKARYATIYSTARWRTSVLNEVVTFRVLFPAKLVRVPVPPAEIGLSFSQTPADNVNINFSGCVISDIDDEGCNVQVASYLTPPPTDTVLRNFALTWLIAD